MRRYRNVMDKLLKYLCSAWTLAHTFKNTPNFKQRYANYIMVVIVNNKRIVAGFYFIFIVLWHVAGAECFQRNKPVRSTLDESFNYAPGFASFLCLSLGNPPLPAWSVCDGHAFFYLGDSTPELALWCGLNLIVACSQSMSTSAFSIGA